MSSNGNGWKPRRPITETCPSGQKVTLMRPGPEFILRSGKVARTFSAALGEHKSKQRPGETVEEYGQRVIAEMDDAEMAALMVLARELVCTILVSPKLVLNPRPEHDEIGPDDIGNDFWWLFNYGMRNFVGIKVPVGETEVEVEDLETFRPESGISGDSVDVAPLPVTESERTPTNTGLVHSTGT